MSFTQGDLRQEQVVLLGADARIDWPMLAGNNPSVSVSVNGQQLSLKNLVNKPSEFTMRDGTDAAWATGGMWRILYSPDFSGAIKTQPIGSGIAGQDAYRFVWNITSYTKPGENKVVFFHPQILATKTTVVVRNVVVETSAVQRVAQTRVAPAPEGPLPTYVSRGSKPVEIRAELSLGGTIRITVGGRMLDIGTRIGEPNGKWTDTTNGSCTRVKPGISAVSNWTAGGCKVTRMLTLMSDHVQVSDRFENTGAEIAGIIYENRLKIVSKPIKILLSGRPTFAQTADTHQPAHPSALVRWNDLTVGLIAEDDIFRNHVRAFAEPGAVGISDPRLGIAPGTSHTLTWSIYPLPKGDYWDFINAVRRNWGSNFTIPAMFTFDHGADIPRSNTEVAQWVKTRGAKWICTGQTVYNAEEIAKYGGRCSNFLGEGTAISLAKHWCSNVVKWVSQVRAADPTAKPMVYLDSMICTEPDADKKYSDCRVLDSAGKQVSTPYSYPIYLYLPTPDNSYGKALFKTVRWLCEDLKVGGIYNDEFCFSPPAEFAYGLPWDGCSVDIDPVSHRVIRKSSSVTLLLQPWKKQMVAYLRRRGDVIIGNGPLRTQTMLKLKVPTCTETASYSFIIETHLGSPIGLTTHDSESDEATRVHTVRRLLDYGGLPAIYAWLNDPVGNHFSKTLYPITPVELRPGVVLGKERIVTNRSGLFGWVDGSLADVYVFDGNGKVVEEPRVRVVKQHRERLTEVRIPGDCFAVLVKKI